MTINDQLEKPFGRLADRVLGGALSETVGRLEQQSALVAEQSAVIDELATELFTSPWRSIPPASMQKFSEQGLYDPEVISQMLRLQSYDLIGGLSSGIDAPGRTDDDRKQAVEQARVLFRRSPLCKWGINTWTSFGLGESVGVKPIDEEAQKVWEAFVTDDRNHSAWQSDTLANMANHLKVTGNRFLSFALSEMDGSAVMRSINPDQIEEIVTHPEDDQTPLFYKRVWVPKGSSSSKTWYYPDWLAFFSGKLDMERPERRMDREDMLAGGGIITQDLEERTLAEEVLPAGAKRTDKMFSAEKMGTTICVLHIADNRLDEDSLFGWPITTDGAPWLRSVQRFFESRLAVAMSKAQFTRRTQVGGGSRAVALAQRLRQSSFQRSGATSETNPPPAPGSEDIVNRAVDVEELPMTTGSGDARSDGEMFAWMALLSLGLFPHFAGIDTQRYATVRGMEKPLLVQFGRYQLFWSSQFRRIVRIVLEANIKYNKGKFESMDAEVSIDKLVELELDALTQGLSRWFRDVLNPAAEQGIIDTASMQKAIAYTTEQVLLTLGAAEPDQLTAGLEVSSVEAVSRALGTAYRMMEEGVIDKETVGLLVKYIIPDNGKE